jgi:hypothetical protein
MIILDYSQIALSNIIVQKLGDEEMIRHMILNSIRMYNKKFKKDFGQIVIAADGSNSWRRAYFPNYKASRKTSRESSAMDWDMIFKVLGNIREELVENSPYKVIRVDQCEADDIIGTLVENTQEFGNHEPVMIVSSDKDFVQLHSYGNVKQYSPIQKKFVQEKNSLSYFFEHVLRGDKGDGVPNVLSGDDVFVNGSRQTPLSAKKMEEYVANAENLKSIMPEDVFRNYQRNIKLIDLKETPKDLKEKIINTYNGYKLPHKTKLMNYLIKKRCKLLIECIEEFY